MLEKGKAIKKDAIRPADKRNDLPLGVIKSITRRLTSVYQIRGPYRPEQGGGFGPLPCVHGELPPIGANRYQTVEIRAQDGGMTIL